VIDIPDFPETPHSHPERGRIQAQGQPIDDNSDHTPLIFTHEADGTTQPRARPYHIRWWLMPTTQVTPQCGIDPATSIVPKTTIRNVKTPAGPPVEPYPPYGALRPDRSHHLLRHALGTKQSTSSPILAPKPPVNCRLSPHTRARSLGALRLPTDE
jgi:hypothetical protein